MSEKNLVNETLLQIQNLEEVINENAKEILASTMKEEISELVKESLKDETDKDELVMIPEEDSEEEDDMEDMEDDMEDMEVDMDDMEDTEDEMEDDMDDMEVDMEVDMYDMEDDSINDLTGETDLNKVFNVFKNMKNSDTVTVVPDGDYTKISDDDEDVEYLLQMESEEESEESEELEEKWEMEEEDSVDEVVYEIEMDEMFDDSEYKGIEEDDDYFDFDKMDNESYNMNEAKKAKKIETKEGMKPKVGTDGEIGSSKKFSYKKSKGGFKEDMKHANPTKGTGKPKFEFKEGEMMDMPSKTKKLSKEEAKEASRTYGFGSKSGRGLRKGITPNRDLTFENHEMNKELEMLRAKNEEYRKALNLFRDKLNEVAIFNSNLAYATRLFTEHSTSKQEKINVLRRFDSAETLKESKALYKTIKDELSQGTKATPITESIERVIEREPQSGSAINLIESKTYENPQFLRMKDIMSKIVK